MSSESSWAFAGCRQLVFKIASTAILVKLISSKVSIQSTIEEYF